MKIPRSIKPDYPLHKLSHGSKVSWNFYSGHKAVVVSIGVLGTVGVILIVKFRDFFDLNTSDRRLAESNFWAVPGLQNLGNNCFLNVILQVSLCTSLCSFDILIAYSVDYDLCDV